MNEDQINPVGQPESNDNPPEPTAPTAFGTSDSSFESAAQSDNMSSQPMSNPSGFAAAGAPKKKSKIGLIITLCVLGVLLIGGAVAGILFLNWRNSDEVVLTDAVTDTLNLRAATITGDISFEFAEAEQGIKSFHLTSNNKTALVPSSSESNLKITLEDDSVVEMDVSSVILSDGVLYFKIAGLGTVLEDLGLTSSFSLDQTAIASIESIIEKVDDQWIKIAFDELLESEMLSSMVESIDTEAYDCSIAAIKNLNTDASRSDLIDLYKEYPFVDATKRSETKEGDYTDFEVTLLKPELIDYLNKVQEKPLFDEFLGCSEDLERHNFTEEDFDQADSSDVTASLVLGIDTNKRKIGHVIASVEDEEASLQARISITERFDSIDIPAPEDATSVNDLIDDIILDIYKIMYPGQDLSALSGLSAS